MQQAKLPSWLGKIVGVLGGGGIFVVAFFDSSVLSFPFVADALVIESVIREPARMPYYCAMAAVGSLAGCVWLYLLANKGGESFFRRRAGKGAKRLKAWAQRNAFLSTLIPSILPPPFPFKAFVVADGVFEVPLKPFALALLFGRGLRYFAEGLLAARYGRVILGFVTSHEIGFAISVLATLVLLYIAGRWIFGGSTAEE